MAKAPTKTKLDLPSSKVDIALTAGSIEPAMKAIEAKSTKLFMVPITAIKPIPGFNVRVPSADYIAHRDMLVQSIRSNGFDATKALAGFVHKEGDTNVIYVTDGYTRLDAANAFNADPDTPSESEITTLPVIVRSPAPTLTDLTVALHTNNNGRPLTPFELGVVVKRLMRDEGADKAAIAARLAVTPRYLDDVLLLVNCPKEVRQAVLDGDISSTLAIQELRKSPEAAVAKISAAVSKAKAAGKAKVTKKALGPKMLKLRHSVSVAGGTDMKEIIRAVAAHVRQAIASVPHATDPEAKVADTDGTISLVIEVPAPEPEAKAPKPKAVKKPAKVKDAPSPAVETTKVVKPKAKKPAAAAPAEEVDQTPPVNDDLGIEGAEEVASDDVDAEIAQTPPAVKSDAEVPDDEESDI